ncbi:hypothetical protein OG589_23985 [Sphaerisporangium sp. NBC_01403]|uniref:hypothetical protein n=1 Tax=Sphaerisporangium sp. NBC_01403 TaxID=2903599 RepID=UPI0032508E94
MTDIVLEGGHGPTTPGAGSGDHAPGSGDQAPASGRAVGPSDEAALRRWLAEALSEACDGEVSASEILGAGCSFVALGVGSLSMVRLIDAIESGLDVEIEFEGDAWFMEDLDSLVGHLQGLTRADLPA